MFCMFNAEPRLTVTSNFHDAVAKAYYQFECADRRNSSMEIHFASACVCVCVCVKLRQTSSNCSAYCGRLEVLHVCECVLCVSPPPPPSQYECHYEYNEYDISSPCVCECLILCVYKRDLWSFFFVGYIFEAAAEWVGNYVPKGHDLLRSFRRA